MSKTKFWLGGGLIAVVALLVLVWVRSNQTQAVDPLQNDSLGLTGRIYVCAVVCDEDQFKKWLGRDYRRLIVFGDASKGVSSIMAMPQDREKAMRRVMSLAKVHGLRII